MIATIQPIDSSILFTPENLKVIYYRLHHLVQRRARRVGVLVRPLAVVCLSLAATYQIQGQEPVPRVSVGFGIDTTITDVRDVMQLMRAYLARPDSSARSRRLWSTATEFDRQVGDVTMGQAYQGFPATIIGVTPAPNAPDGSVYVVKVLYARTDSTRRVMPLALQRLYAIREPDGPFPFRLSGALPRLTRAWERRSMGRMTFWYAPGQHPNEAKIVSAVHFVDSVATLFGVTPPKHLDVYITASGDEAERAIGLDFFPEAAGPGGGHGSLNLGSGIVLVGNPAIGEAYSHEFVHAVLNPTLPAGSALFAEGVATWLGGSQGRTPHQMYALLHQYQEAHPTVTLANLLHDDPIAGGARAWTDLTYATGALVVDAVYRRAGIPGLRGLARMRGDPDAIVAALPAQLGLTASGPDALDRWWRNEAQRAEEMH